MRQSLLVYWIFAIVCGVCWCGAAIAQDSDNDGLPDAAETRTYFTDPNDADTDNDYQYDGLEVLDGANPNSIFSYSTMPRTMPAALNTNAEIDSGRDERINLATDRAGHWVVVWHSDDSLGGTIGTDRDILTSRSSDNGQTWTDPVALYTNASADLGNDMHPRIATNGTGTWIVVWFLQNAGGIHADGDIMFARSVDNGETWTTPAALNTNAATDSGSDEAPKIATDGAGNWVVAWESGDSLGGTIGTDLDILVSRSANNGVTWTSPAALNTTAAADPALANESEVDVAMDGAGNCVAVWRFQNPVGGTFGTDADVMVSRSTDFGASWSAPAALNSDATTDSGLDVSARVATNGMGTWIAVWRVDDSLGGTIGTDGDIALSRSSDNGATWTPIATLNTNATTDSGFDGIPDITTDRMGVWVVTWTSRNSLNGLTGTDADIHGARSINNGVTWTVPAAVNTNAAIDSGDDLESQGATDGAGNWIGVWYSNDTLNGATGDYDILFTRTPDTDNDGLSDIAEFAEGTGVGDPDTDDDGVPDGAEVNIHGTDPHNWDSDFDGQYDGLEILDGTNPNNSFSFSLAPRSFPYQYDNAASYDTGNDLGPQIATDGNLWLSLWSSDDTRGETIGSDGDILLGIATAGQTTFATFLFNTNAETDSGADFEPQLTNDGGENWVGVWTSNDSLGGTIGTDLDILFSTLNINTYPNSAPAALNTNAATDSGDDSSPQVATDGLGNWVVVWQSTDTLGGTIGEDWDILVSRSTNNGVTWTAPVALNTNAATDDSGQDQDTSPQLSTDAAGHWVAVWETTNTLGGTIGSEGDIVVSRSTNNGVTWTAPAPLNSDATFDSSFSPDESPYVTTDRLGNWVAVWSSWVTFDGQTEIQVARSTDNGATWTTAAPINLNPPLERPVEMTPKVTTDGAGLWFAVWESDDPLNGLVGFDPDILGALSINNGATWTPASTLNLNAMLDSGWDREPTLTTDGIGNWVGAWASDDSLQEWMLGDDFDILSSFAYLPATPNANNLFVKFGVMTNGIGTAISPASNLAIAAANANNSAMIKLYPGVSNEVFTGVSRLGLGNRPVTLNKVGTSGTPVRIGVQP